MRSHKSCPTSTLCSRIIAENKAGELLPVQASHVHEVVPIVSLNDSFHNKNENLRVPCLTQIPCLRSQVCFLAMAMARIFAMASFSLA